MSIKNCYRQGKPVVSFEVFPPKKDADIAGIYAALGAMAALRPDFISVTYGAGGGGNVNRTAEIAAVIKNEHGIPPLAHLTCVGADRERIAALLDDMGAQGLHNVLALRGDLPDGQPLTGDYRHARDLVAEIRARGDFCIAAACYPEGHIDCEDLDQDITRLLQKQEAGADLLISQLFFDNELFLRFLERARKAGVTLPISAGVMPILGRKQIERMIFLCGASLPSRIIKLLHRYEHNPEDLRKAGIEYAALQLAGLLDRGVDGVHIYTMNKPDIAITCMDYIAGKR